MDAAPITGLADARAALARGQTTLIAPAAGGAAWCAAIAALLKEEPRARLVFDCGDDAALVFEALRLGIRDIAYRGARCRELADLAARQGATLHG